MNTVVLEPVNMNSASGGGAMSQMARNQKMRLLAAMFILVVLLGAGFFFSQQSDWRVLFANLSDKDAGEVSAQLSQSGVPYRLSEGGVIMVPGDKVHEMRLRMATQGLPKGSVVGFELLDNPRLGITQFQERLSFQRGLEGELTRSILALGAVQSARVHLALPNQNGFFREQQKPSASVLVGTVPGRSLDRAQVAGIVHLVASSVPELNPESVSVIDSTGALLSNPSEAASGIDTAQLQYVRQLEQSLTRRIQEILTPILGANNVKAQVNVDVDFTRTELTAESHQPSGEGGAIRSQQVVESADAASRPAAGGVPGAASNQPGTSAATTTAAAPAAGSGRRESVTNYEVDRTVKVVREATGVIKRVSAAVVVNHQTTVDEDGEPVTKALPPEQLEQMRTLVRDAIGFNEARGDSLNLMNAPFTIEKVELPIVAWWQQPEMHSLLRSLAWMLGVSLVAILALFIVVRPMMMGLRKAAQAVEPLLDAVVAEQPERPAVAAALPTTPPPPATPAIALTPVESDQRLQEARKLSQENPAAVAGIIKSWMQSDNG